MVIVYFDTSHKVMNFHVSNVNRLEKGFFIERGICEIYEHQKASMIFGITTTTTKLTLGAYADVKSMILFTI